MYLQIKLAFILYVTELSVVKLNDNYVYATFCIELYFACFIVHSVGECGMEL